MRKGIIKLSVGAALAAAIGFVPTANAQIAEVTHIDPAEALVMPYDVTENHASFQLVSRISGATTDPVATHWSFWSESCDHLADVFICLTQKDTVVVDPTALQGQIQNGNENKNTGPVINLSGTKGFVTVTAFPFLAGSQSCATDGVDPTGEPSLVGSWVVANTTTNAAFGNNAIGILESSTLPDASLLDGGDDPTAPQGLFLQTFDPTSLQDSEVFFIGVSYPAGNGQFADTEIGPVPALLSNGHAISCDAEYCDNVETCVSLPDITLDCSSSRKIADNDALGNDDTAIIPASIPADTSGFVRLNNCIVGTNTGTDQGISNGVGDDGNPAFLFAFHGMAVGPFGNAASGKYTLQ